MALSSAALVRGAAAALTLLACRAEPPPEATVSASTTAPSAAPSSALSTPARFVLGRGEVRISNETVSPSADDLRFIQPVVPGGARNCYVEALRVDPKQEGAIDFTLSSPPKEGAFVHTVALRGNIGPSLGACFERVLETWYHYDGKPAVRYTGTLEFRPTFEEVAPPPSDATVRRVVAQRYAKEGVVKVVDFHVDGVVHHLSSPSFLRRYSYGLQLEYLTAGWEADCQHNGRWKVLSRERHQNDGAGVMCTDTEHAAGDRVADGGSINFTLTSRGWEAPNGGGTYCGDALCP